MTKSSLSQIKAVNPEGNKNSDIGLSGRIQNLFIKNAR
jgi:hypothetical protein